MLARISNSITYIITITISTIKSRQVIVDVALTGVDGQSRTSDEAVERPLQVRYD